MFDKDIILDQGEFKKAIDDYAALSASLSSLTAKVKGMISSLETGFNTPAGAKFINACAEHLIRPLQQQEEVIKHISQTLTEVDAVYKPVFTKYAELADSINRLTRN